MRLFGRQHKQLQEALIDAFPSKPSLEQMLWNELDKNLDATAEGDNLPEIVFNLIKQAQAEGWIKELIRAARKANPRNEFLIAAEESILLVKLSNSLKT